MPTTTTNDDLKTRQVVVWVSIGIAVIALAALIVWKINASGDDMPTSAPNAAVPETPPATRPADFKVLVGRWVRTDTPYVIEIKAAKDDGTLQAAYYNPRSINVPRAEARDNNGKTQVFLELRDTNYPGSNYTLTYDPARDLLHGVYFQAALRQSFNVAFRRLRPQTEN